MKCIFLAAGYATRLYPLTENFPKPLLDVGGKTILDWLIDDLQTTGLIDEYIVVTNHKFADIFRAWAEEKAFPVTVLDDGTCTNETRLGAVCDIRFAAEHLNPGEDLLVLAGDNVLDFSLAGFLRYAQEKQTSCVLRYFEADTKTLPKRGVLELDEDRVIGMEEKPAVPKTNWCCPPFYYLIAQDAEKIDDAIRDGCGTDAPGSFIAWLAAHSAVHAMEMPGNRYDVGSLESYNEIKKLFQNKSSMLSR